MLKNYLTIAIRNLARHKAYTFINVIGLAIGLTCSTLTLLYLQYEFSHDRHHSKADRIYKVFKSERLPSGKIAYYYATHGPAAPAMADELPEIERATRFLLRNPSVSVDGKEGLSSRAAIVDREFFNVFDFPLHEGNALTGLQQPFSIFVTQHFAQLLFGNEDPMGKTVKLSSKLFDDHSTITGILKDLPENSTQELAPDLITMTSPRKFPERMIDAWDQWEGSFWGQGIARTYILLKTNASQTTLKQKLSDFAIRHLGSETAKTTNYELLSLKDLHFQGYQKYGLLTMAAGRIGQCSGLASGVLHNEWLAGELRVSH